MQDARPRRSRRRTEPYVASSYEGTPRLHIDLEAYEVNIIVKLEVRNQLVSAFYDEGIVGTHATAVQVMRLTNQW